jgi:hypothetical protein
LPAPPGHAAGDTGDGVARLPIDDVPRHVNTSHPNADFAAAAGGVNRGRPTLGL